MRNEFASKSFIAVERFLAVAGVILLCSGFAFAFT
jgi:hypothetical protein